MPMPSAAVAAPPATGTACCSCKALNNVILIENRLIFIHYLKVSSGGEMDPGLSHGSIPRALRNRSSARCRNETPAEAAGVSEPASLWQMAGEASPERVLAAMRPSSLPMETVRRNEYHGY
jgi:hypothetical protein